MKIVWLKLDNPHIGEDYRRKFKEMYRKDSAIDKTWTPIFAIDRRFNIGAKGSFQVSRIMFPLTNAAARTLWKMQSGTILLRLNRFKSESKK